MRNWKRVVASFVPLCLSLAPATVAANTNQVSLGANSISVNFQGTDVNECALTVAGYPENLMYASLRLLVSGTEGGFIAAGIRYEDTVLIADQTILTGEARYVVLDVTAAVKYALDNQLETFTLGIGPGILGGASEFRLEEFEHCWGQLRYFAQPQCASFAKSKIDGHSAAELGEIAPQWTDDVSVQVSPNPANPQTTFSVNVDRATTVILDIYDVRGRLIRRFSQHAAVGTQLTVRWNGSDGTGRQVPSGVYFYRLAGDAIQTRTGKMSIVR